jgi:hypothetical protein
MLCGRRYGGNGKVVDYRDSTYCTLVQCTFSFLFLFPYFLSIVLRFKEYNRFLFNSCKCHFFSILQSAFIATFIILVQYTLYSTVCIVCYVSNLATGGLSLEGPHGMKKNIIIQTQYKYFVS